MLFDQFLHHVHQSIQFYPSLPAETNYQMSSRYIFLFITAITANTSIAQIRSEVVNAEFSFAATAKAFTMKKAFLENMDSTAVVFEQGQILNGIEYWSKAAESPGKLLWHPAFNGMSQAGDLGFTTGPWEYHAKPESPVIASGQYTTVWKKNKNGEWKFLVDLGVDYSINMFGQQRLSASETFVPAKKNDTSALNIEYKFLELFTADKQKAFEQSVYYNTWLNTDGRQPLQLAALVLPELSKLPETLSFKPVAGGMSSSRDLAYVYGVISYGEKQENYLRIWGHTKDGWKIIVQVIKK
jgi:ketosteroid isomerase-like protein